MRQQVADRSPQRHATLPTYYKILLRTEKVLLRTTLTVNATQFQTSNHKKTHHSVMCLHCTKNPRPRSLLSTQSFSHRSDNLRSFSNPTTTQFFFSSALYFSSASRNLQNTVDYCIDGGLLRHAAAHSTACKQKNSRSGINFFTDMLPHPCQCSTRT